MSVIAVRKDGKKIFMSSDSQTTCGHNKYPKFATGDKETKDFGKVFYVNGMYLGCAGRVRDIQLLQIFSKTHRPKGANVDYVLEWLFEFRDWHNSKADKQVLNIAALLVLEGIVFEFDHQLLVYKIDDFGAVGSGSFLCMGAMEVGADTVKAVEVAIKYDLYCGGIVNTVVIE